MPRAAPAFCGDFLLIRKPVAPVNDFNNRKDHGVVRRTAFWFNRASRHRKLSQESGWSRRLLLVDGVDGLRGLPSA